MCRTQIISALRDRLAVCSSGQVNVVRTCVGAIRLGALHEWVGVDDGAEWCPPVCLLADLARCAAREGMRVVWVGRRVWPTPLLVEGWPGVVAASVFVDPPDKASLWWCVDIAARAGGAVVIADGSGLTLAASRRLQLAAGAGRGACVVARPSREVGSISSATTRRRVERERSWTGRPRWRVTLERDKDDPRALFDRSSVVVELDHGEGCQRVGADVGDRQVRQDARAS